MKIRFYPIDQRKDLRDIQNSRWEEALHKVIYCSLHRNTRSIEVTTFQFLQNLSFPYDDQVMADRTATMDWLIGTAIRFEYGDNGTLLLLSMTSDERERCLHIVDKYKSVTASVSSQTSVTNENKNPLETLDCKSIRICLAFSISSIPVRRFE